MFILFIWSPRGWAQGRTAGWKSTQKEDCPDLEEESEDSRALGPSPLDQGEGRR